MRITSTISDELHQRLQDEADKRQKTISRLVADILSEALTEGQLPPQDATWGGPGRKKQKSN